MSYIFKKYVFIFQSLFTIIPLSKIPSDCGVCFDKTKIQIVELECGHTYHNHCCQTSRDCPQCIINFVSNLV